MDISSMLFQAAREGNLDVLLQENPLILADARLTSLTESILHVATKLGHLNVVCELMTADADIAREMNKDGYRPLDVAVIMGNLEIVKTFLSFDRDLGRLAGKDNRSALHYAAVKGRIEIINELLSTYPSCLENVTVYGETALHLAVKYHQFDAFYELIKWVERESKELIINIRDGDGNTVLHLAVLAKQYACLNLLLDNRSSIKGTLKLNVTNFKGLTPLDISDMVIQDSYDAKIRETLQRAGAIRAQDPTTSTAQNPPQPDPNPQQPEPASRNWLEYFKFKKHRDSPSEARNTLLIVAALITTVTFQAAINPPSRFFDESRRLNRTDQQNLEIYFILDFMFVFFNSLGFVASSLILIYLTSGFPFYRELFISTSSMLITYSNAMVINVTGAKVERKIQVMAWFVQLVAFVLPQLLRWPPWLKKTGWGGWRRRAVRNVGLPIGNASTY